MHTIGNCLPQSFLIRTVRVRRVEPLCVTAYSASDATMTDYDRTSSERNFEGECWLIGKHINHLIENVIDTIEENHDDDTLRFLCKSQSPWNNRLQVQKIRQGFLKGKTIH